MLIIRRIERPDWARTMTSQWSDHLPLAERGWIEQHRDELLSTLHQAVVEYLTNLQLGGSGQAGETTLPDFSRVTGEYYLGDEAYFGSHEANYPISVQCRFLEKSWLPHQKDLDYLCLEVWIDVDLVHRVFRVEHIDASSI